MCSLPQTDLFTSTQFDGPVVIAGQLVNFLFRPNDQVQIAAKVTDQNLLASDNVDVNLVIKVCPDDFKMLTTNILW